MPASSTLLVVDDNGPALKATVRLLEQAGYQVAQAQDGASALRQIRTLRPRLVLLDVVLPDISGREVLREVRADPVLQNVAVVLLSAERTTPEHQADGLDGGADGYIARPIAHTELLARVRGHLRQRELTEQLRASDEKFRHLAENITDVFWIRSADFSEVHYVSPAFERIWGRPVESLHGNPHQWADFIHPDDRSRVTAAFAALTKEAPSLDIEYRILRPDGEIRWVRARGYQVRDAAENRVIRHTGIVTDITEKKKFEDQLRRAQRMESVGTLAGGIAHELNNLLAPIVMGAGLLRQLEARPESLPVLDAIERSANRASALIKQVLSFARGIEGTRVTLDLRSIIQEIDAIARETFPRNITVETGVADDLWPVTADPAQIKQVLLNLALNARDAMPSGGRLSIHVDPKEIAPAEAAAKYHGTPGRFARIVVTDSGTGMPPEVVERIFEPFFTTKPFGQGTGLGLSTVLAIVRSHGGFVNVESALGKGSAFSVFLPSRPAPEAEALPKAAPGALPRGRGEMILIVDDEPTILAITRQILETFGYRVVTAEDGAQAMALYTQHQNEVQGILTDMMMPVMDGPALIAAVRRLHPTVPIIAASGLSGRDNPTGTVGPGGVHALAKPYEAETLLRLVRKLLDDGR